ncbi:MAG TPA: S-layer homology domain-containing protein, partial [Symbiobacteriaceae bacterium]|nr:S-layer homology domain-containing protein [Symbiobacteriaceae bacterium]
MTRRWSVLALAASLIFGAALPVAAQSPPPATTPGSAASDKPASPAPAGFQDLPQTHWAYASVLKLKEAGIITGDPGGNFRPEEPVRRDELFKMVLKARHIDPGTACRGIFPDAPCGTWHAPWVETAFRLAIAEERPTGYFEPEAYVTRQELFTAMVRAVGRRWDAASLGW